MNNTIKIETDSADCEVSVNITECYLTNKEINILQNMLWELSWEIEADFEATNHKNQQWFIYSLPYTGQIPLDDLAEKLREKVQELFSDKFVTIN